MLSFSENTRPHAGRLRAIGGRRHNEEKLILEVDDAILIGVAFAVVAVFVVFIVVSVVFVSFVAAFFFSVCLATDIRSSIDSPYSRCHL